MNITDLDITEYEPEWWERLLQVSLFLIPTIFAGLAALGQKKKLRRLLWRTKKDKEEKVIKHRVKEITFKVDETLPELLETTRYLRETVESSLGRRPSVVHAVGSEWPPTVWSTPTSQEIGHSSQQTHLSADDEECSVSLLQLSEEGKSAV